MIHYRFGSDPSPLFECDVCNKPINEHDVLLVRSVSALPEERTFYIHPRCLHVFERTHPGKWTLIPGDSVEAGWLM